MENSQKIVARLPLYVRLGFGMIILFGMVGNCAGHHEKSVIIFVLTAVIWACLRIIEEAVASVQLLHAIKEHNASLNRAPEKKDPPAPPPASPPSDPPAAT